MRRFRVTIQPPIGGLTLHLEHTAFGGNQAPQRVAQKIAEGLAYTFGVKLYLSACGVFQDNPDISWAQLESGLHNQGPIRLLMEVLPHDPS